MQRLLIGLTVSLVLTACGSTPENFQGPQVLRGVWKGLLGDPECSIDPVTGKATCVVTEGVKVRLELTATPVGAIYYNVSGTMQLDDGEKLVVAGSVIAGETHPYLPTTSSFDGTASSNNQVIWKLGATRSHGDGPRWFFSIGEPQVPAETIRGDITRE
jgi:hypothetical protein